jgi:CheY-like chemotaxis protein
MNDAVFILSSLLKKLGHEVETARDAVSAVEAVRRIRPEIVFSDIAMPGVDGYELARRLRQMPESANITLVALTGYGQKSDRQRAADAGFDYHLVKPIGIGDLRELLTSASRSLSPTLSPRT